MTDLNRELFEKNRNLMDSTLNMIEKYDRVVAQLTALRAEHATLRGALAAQDEREKQAGERCGVPYELHGCDWPDAVAEKLTALRGALTAKAGQITNAVLAATTTAQADAAVVQILEDALRSSSASGPAAQEVSDGKEKEAQGCDVRSEADVRASVRPQYAQDVRNPAGFTNPAKELAEWIEHYYGALLVEAGCPCDGEKRCPLHAAFSEATPQEPPQGEEPR